MTITGSTRQKQDFVVEYASLGLNTIDDPVVVNAHSAKDLKNLRAMQYVLKRRYGTTLASEKMLGRPTGLHQSYPVSLSPSGRRYYSSRNNIRRITGNIPHCIFEDIVFPFGKEWGLSDFVMYNDFDDYTFAFNGKDYGMELSADNVLNKARTFQIEKPEFKPSVTSVALGSITGKYRWKYRYVRNYIDGSREYMGAYSDQSDELTLAAENAKCTFIPPHDEQVNAIRWYRTAAGGSTFFFLEESTDITSGIFIDDNATTETRLIDYPLIPRLKGIKYGCNDSGVHVVFGSSDEDNVLYWSMPETPQEFHPDYTTKFIEGRGKSMGIGSINGYLVAWREKGMLTLQMNANGVYDRVQYKGDVGNIAPHSITACFYKGKNWLSFWDDEQGPCLTDGINVISLKVVSKPVGDPKYGVSVNTDIFFIVKNNMKPNCKKNICAAFNNNQLIYSFSLDSTQDTHNDSAVIFDFTVNGWFGIDSGYNAGPMFSCLGSQGIAGTGELLCMHDGDSTALIHMFDEASNYDYDFVNTAFEDRLNLGTVTTNPLTDDGVNLKEYAYDKDDTTLWGTIAGSPVLSTYTLNVINSFIPTQFSVKCVLNRVGTVTVNGVKTGVGGYTDIGIGTANINGSDATIVFASTAVRDYNEYVFSFTFNGGSPVAVYEIKAFASVPAKKNISIRYQSPKIGAKHISRVWEFAKYWLVAKISRNLSISFNTYSNKAVFSRTIIQKPYNAGTWDESLWDEGLFGEINWYTYEKGLPCYNQGIWTEVTIEDNSDGVLEISAFKIKGIDKGEL